MMEIYMFQINFSLGDLQIFLKLSYFVFSNSVSWSLWRSQDLGLGGGVCVPEDIQLSGSQFCFLSVMFYLKIKVLLKKKKQKTNDLLIYLKFWELGR